MNLAANPALWLLIPALPISLWAMHSDVSRMIIPNRAVLALLGGFVAVGILVLPLDAFAWRIGIGVLALVVGFLLTLIGGLGAGDAKFFAAMAPFVALHAWADFMFLLSFCMGAGFVLHRIARMTPLRTATAGWESWERRDFPMGLSLGTALVAHLMMEAFL